VEASRWFTVDVAIAFSSVVVWWRSHNLLRRFELIAPAGQQPPINIQLLSKRHDVVALLHPLDACAETYSNTVSSCLLATCNSFSLLSVTINDCLNRGVHPKNVWPFVDRILNTAQIAADSEWESDVAKVELKHGLEDIALGQSNRAEVIDKVLEKVRAALEKDIAPDIQTWLPKEGEKAYGAKQS